jgi:hypothetical protein
MHDIEKAEKVLLELEEKRECIVHREKTLDKKRQALSYAAETGDKKARNELDTMNGESLSNSNNIKSVEAALVVARQNLAQAKVAEANAADRANALALREKLKRFIELGLVLDDCFADFRSAAIEMNTVLDDIHNLGQVAPTAMQFKVNCDLAFKTAVMGTPFWNQDFPALGHGQKKTFRSLVESWSANIEANIAARLGEESNANKKVEAA